MVVRTPRGTVRAGRTQVMLRASQINGCGWCVDLHT
ncbi:hypothetical protein [Actinomadura luteofluorescens]